ncbi:MAG: DUF1828 domain-containing protein [Planctomycetota bacterium]|nr:DUF1828 domain-containing protein [Planctomycetota bacterium]
MQISGLKRKLCKDFLLEAESTELGSVAVTSFMYPNGDSVNLYFENFGDGVCVSDEGATTSFLKTQGIELSAERRQIIKTMCNPYDVEFVTPVLRKQFKMDGIGAACLALCEAITSVSSIFYVTASPSRSSLPIAVEKLLKAKVEPKRGVVKHWIDRRHDPKASFPVDFHLNGIGEPRDIFSVTSASKSIMVVAVVNFLRSHRVKTPTLAIVDKNADLGPVDLNRLQITADELFFGIDRNEDKIVKFALSSSGK